MFVSTFLKPTTPCEAMPFHRRSKLFTRRAAMRCIPVSEPPSISPMTAALVSVANQRTECPEVPSTSDLVTADVESGTEAQVVVQMKGKNSGRKRKNEVPGAPLRKRSRRNSGGLRKRKTEPGAAMVKPVNSAVIPPK